VLNALLPGAAHLQNVHPLIVHFPLAFLTGAPIVYLLAWLTGRHAWASLALWLLVLGTLLGAVAVGTGLYAEDGVMVARSVRAELLVPHKRIMLATAALAAVLTIWAAVDRPLPRRGRAVFVVLLLVMLALLTKGADYGGRLVYDYNAGGNACGQPIDFSQ
jgi:uncharacterized membrane protein